MKWFKKEEYKQVSNVSQSPLGGHTERYACYTDKERFEMAHVLYIEGHSSFL